MEHLRAGAISGLVTCISLQPIDVIKTRLQEQPGLRIGDACRGINGQFGLPGFWRGTIPSLLRTVPGGALYFASIGQAKYLLLVASIRWKGFPDLIDPKTKQCTPLGGVIVGGAARSFAGFLLIPMTVIKTRFESKAFAGQKSMLDAASQIWRNRGISGFWAGWGSTIMRDAPYAGIYLAAYEHLKRSFGADNMTKKGGCAFAAGTVATIATHPFDYIRTRIQLDPVAYPNSLSTIRKVWSQSGPSGFFPGIFVMA